VELNEPWAVRERSVVVQNLETMPHYARELVDMIRAFAKGTREVQTSTSPADARA